MLLPIFAGISTWHVSLSKQQETYHMAVSSVKDMSMQKSTCFNPKYIFRLSYEKHSCSS